MLICDQYLAIRALAGALPEELEGQRLAMASSHYWLLLRADAKLRDRSSGARGRLGARIEQLSPVARERLVAPPPDVIELLDFREYAYVAARVAQRFRLNWLVADLVGAAVHHRAPLRFGNRHSVPPLFREGDDARARIPYRILE